MQTRKAYAIALIITIASLLTGCSSKSSNSNNSNNANRATSAMPQNTNIASEVESTVNAAMQSPGGRTGSAASDNQTATHSTKNSTSKNGNKTATLDSSRPHQSANNAVRQGRRIANEGERQIRNILGRP